MLSIIKSTAAGLSLAALFALSPATAETITFRADLKAASEVPPTNSSGVGDLTATYDSVSKTLNWKGTVSGLTGAPTAAHFHGPAETGKNAGVLVPAPGIKAGAFEGSATLTDDQAKVLTAGQTYFNIHTAANPNGEVRGQVTKGQ